MLLAHSFPDIQAQFQAHPGLFFFSKQMFPLPLELVLEIFIRLDYTCFPKILHVNRDVRAWALDNWTLILNSRSTGWGDQIPREALWKLNNRLSDICAGRDSIQKREVLKALLLKGARYVPPSYQCFHQSHLQKFLANGRVELAQIRNLLC
jgi:hypothetical protein